jgi:F-type H+-transporting ATPase subunit b
MTIDWWTLGIQTVNVAILVWLLQRFFWRPVAAIIEQRRDATTRTLTEAAATRAQSLAALAEIEQTRAGFVKERGAILAEANDTAGTARTAILAEAGKAAAALEADAKAAIEAATRAAEQVQAQKSAQLAITIAQRLAARLVGAAVREAFLAWLVAAIDGLPEPDRRAIAGGGATIEVVSAASLDPAEQARAGAAIRAAFGGDVSLVFDVDPELIAGLELRGPHLLVSNSWRADLAEILASFSRRIDKAPPGETAPVAATAELVPP